jgi:prolyl oligopeptidase
VEQLHGHAVSDPYRWLEASSEDPDVRAFVAAQNELTAAHLAGASTRSAFRARLSELWGQPRRGAPWRRGDHWFQIRNDGTQDQDVLWAAATTRGDPGALPAEASWRILLDPNGWSDDGTAALSGLAPTVDGRLLAFARSDAGSDWATWRVVEVASAEVLPDTVPWAKFSGAAWLPDGSGFLYGAYDPPAAGELHAAANRAQRLQLHRLGDDAADDRVVHERPDDPELTFAPAVSHDGRWLLLYVSRGTDPTNRIHVASLEGTRIGPVTRLLDDADARYVPLGVHGDELLVRTDLDAPLGRVVAIDLHDRSRRREIVPESPDRLQDALLVGAGRPGDPGWLVCHHLHHATSRLAVHDLASGAHVRDVPLPGVGSVGAVTGGRWDDAIHLAFESFDTPSAVLRHDLPEGRTSEVTAAGAGSGPEIVVEQVHVRHDGVAVPLFLVRRDDVTPDGAAPTVLWGYGGFDIPVTPMYRPDWRAWVDAGGLLAVACLRGGGEYGRSWHDDGRLANKQHVFDDALACAAWLTGRRRQEVTAAPLTEGTDAEAIWTAPRHLGIEGRSNGGLLVGACITQEPEAFGSAVPEVGVLDLVRFHRFTIGWAWTSDYGSPDDPEDLAVLLAYSPYHRVQPGTGYPPTLITTGDTDDRVVPAHSYKFAAALQAANTGDHPVLLRVDTSAGHGAGKPVSKLLDERADVLAFHAHHLGLGWPIDVPTDDRPDRHG